MIEVNGLTRSFRDNIAVRDLSFSVNKGEIFGIVGPDGAGKSTLLRMLAGLLKADDGSILIDGMQVRTGEPGIKAGIAYMPQRFGLYEDLTVEENIFFFGHLFGMSSGEIRKKLPLLYGFSGLEPFSDRLAGKLSGGMKQKLGLSCCLVHKPGLILLDEPTNGVDPVSRREFWRILYDIIVEGVAIIVSTAYLDEAERCGRVGLMYRGSFVTVGTPDEVKRSVERTMMEISTDDPMNAEAVLRKSDRFRRVIRTGSFLRFFTDRPEEDRKEAVRILGEAKLKAKSITPRQPDLEDVFIEIIGHEGE